MNPKSNTNKWSDIQLAIAAISMTSVIAFWNLFAGPDKVQADKKAAEQQAQLIPTIAPTVTAPPAPVATMPPTGYTILFGGKAPQPQVIVVQKPKGGGGDGNVDSGGGGGGGGAPASQPSTSTGSS